MGERQRWPRIDIHAFLAILLSTAMTKPLPPTVYIVDDDMSVREALSSLIRSVGLHVETFSSALSFLEHQRSSATACVVLDVRMPGMSGLDVYQQLRTRGDLVPIVFITGHGDIPMAVRAIKAGAVEFLAKPFRDQDLLDAIRQALEQEQGARQEREEQMAIRTVYETLTSREKEVAALIVSGALNKQVAAQLGVTEITIKVHRHNIMQKMKVRSLVELVRAIERLEAFCRS